MRSTELQPSVRNIIDTYVENSIGRNRDVNAFIDLLNAQKGSCAMAIDGAWGAGKTFFVKQVKMILDICSGSGADAAYGDDAKEIEKLWKGKRSKNAPELESHFCVYYDAWQNDNDADPILSLVYSILQDVDDTAPLQEGSGILRKAAAIAEVITGRNVTALAEAFENKCVLDDIRRNKDIQRSITDFFNDLLPERANRLVIIIDELDRCRPDYAVRLLEKIKHYFADERITFVFSTNLAELQHTISRYYGDAFDACRYLDRFFDLRVELPPVDLDKFYQYIGFQDDYVVDSVSNTIVRMFGFSLRETSRYLMLVKTAVYKPTHEKNQSLEFEFADGKGRQFCLLYVVPLIIGLKLKDLDQYQSFISGRDSSPLVNLFKELNRDNYRYGFVQLLNNNETYNERESGDDKCVVTLQQKTEDVYSAIFNAVYDRQNYHMEIGNLDFDATVKTMVMNVASLLSKYATYN